MKNLINKEDIAKKLYNLNRTLIKKRITNNLGKVVEEDDKIICYVKKNKCKKEKFNYIIACHGIRKKDKELLEKYNLNKPICYIIDGLKFEDDKVNIWGYNNCEVIIKNCHFGFGLQTHINGKCTFENTYIRDLSYLSLSAKDLIIKNMDISNQLKYSDLRLGIILAADNKLEINNSSIGRIKEKTNVRLLAGKQLEIYNSKISGDIVECESPKIIAGKKSSIEAKDKVDLHVKDFYEINIISPILNYNNRNIETENKHLTLKKVNQELDIKRLDLIELLKEIKKDIEIKNQQDIDEYIVKLTNQPIIKTLKKGDK